MFNFGLRAKFSDHSVVQISTIVYDNPFGDAILTYKIMLDEPSYYVLGNGSKRGCLYPLCKVIDSHKNETMSIGSGRFNFSNHVNAPHCKRPRSSQNV